MIENIYPDYLNEYETLLDIREMSNQDIDNFLQWHLGRKSSFWSSSKKYVNHSDYTILPGFTFEEIYDVSAGLNSYSNEYGIINNIPKNMRKNDWDSMFVTDQNRERVIDGIEKSVGRFFLYSIDDNPNYEKQEELSSIGTRYHLG